MWIKYDLINEDLLQCDLSSLYSHVKKQHKSKENLIQATSVCSVNVHFDSVNILD